MSDGADRLIRAGWRGWLTLFGAWTIPALIAPSAVYLSMQSGQQQMSWGWLFVLQTWIWYFWAAISPTLYRLAARRPLSGREFFKNSVIHLAVAAVIALTVSALYMVGRELIYGNQLPLGEAIIKNTFGGASYVRHLLQVLIYAMVVGALSMIRLNRQRTLREQRDARVALELQQARLAALGSQLQPHFLFNTLNSVSALIEEKQNDRAFEMVARISELLRLSLEGGVSAEIALGTELQFVERYVEIERLRFEDRLRIASDISAELRAARVPSLILQPLVENCVRHGVEQSSRPVEVALGARADGKTLTITVSDTGPGLPSEWNGASSYGIGLRNVTERLRTLYGPRGALELRRREPHGVIATITLPLSSATPEAGG